MEVYVKKSDGDNLKLLSSDDLSTLVADTFFPVGFSFLSLDTKVPKFGKWSVESKYYAIMQNYNGGYNAEMYKITRTKWVTSFYYLI